MDALLFTLFDIGARLQQFLDAGGPVLRVIAVVIFIMWIMSVERLFYVWRTLPRMEAKAREAWEALYPPLRRPYRAAIAPGAVLGSPHEADPDPNAVPNGPDQGFENFAFVPIRVMRMEYLHLRPTGHRRARFEWGSDWQGQWLAP